MVRHTDHSYSEVLTGTYALLKSVIHFEQGWHENINDIYQ